VSVTWICENCLQRTLRYFVRSYVTKPTTINAITDIPAKIPRPIGSTEIFFPGIWKAAEVVDAEAEALSATVTADVPLLVDFEACVVAPVVGDGVGDGVIVGTEEEPYKKVRVPCHSNGHSTMDGLTELELVGVGTDEDEEETVMLERGMELKKTFDGCYHSKNSKLTPDTYKRRCRGRCRCSDRSALYRRERAGGGCGS